MTVRKPYRIECVPIPPMVARAEKVGLPRMINGKYNKYGMVPRDGYGFGGYLIGFKLASKMKKQLRQFFLDCNRFKVYYKTRPLTAKDSREMWKNDFHIDFKNPYTFEVIYKVL